MKTGTKSILFGVHQFLIHPVTVFLAWVWLYRKLPNWRECVCILIHDWGYVGYDQMDSKGGEKHPEYAAGIAYQWLGDYYYRLCLFHSRHYARQAGIEPSLLCWADKFSLYFERWWTYLPRARLSGELIEYRFTAHVSGHVHWNVPDREWFEWIREKSIKCARARRGDAVPYMNQVEVQNENG
jgi:hypothetical protein